MRESPRLHSCDPAYSTYIIVYLFLASMQFLAQGNRIELRFLHFLVIGCGAAAQPSMYAS